VDAVNELLRILDREAVVIEHVLFRLKAVELLLAADEHRFLAQSADELTEAVERLGALEALRAVAAERVGEAVGAAPGEVVLSDALRLADDAQRAGLLRAQLRLRGLLDELEAQAALDKDFALGRIAQVRAALERLSGAPASRYGQDGMTERMRPPSAFDQKL
jgi:hypothetical protein